MIKLGSKIKDKVTGMEGIAISKVEYLNGCVQYCLKPKAKKGETKMPEGVYIDYNQLEVIGKGLNVKKKNTGGVMTDTPKK